MKKILSIFCVFLFCSAFLCVPQIFAQEKQYSISGFVTNKDGAGVSGVEIKISGKAQGIKRTDSTGYYRFDEIPHEAKIEISAKKDNYSIAPSVFRINSVNSNRTINFKAVKSESSTSQPQPSSAKSSAPEKSSYDIKGRVSYYASGLVGVKVSVTGSKNVTVYTDVNGYYSIKDIKPSGNTTLVFSKDGYKFNPEESDLTYIASDTTINAEASIETFKISGTITEGKNPIEGVLVKISNGADEFTGLTNEKGYYEITRLPYGNNFLIIASKEGVVITPLKTIMNKLISDKTVNFSANVRKFKVSGFVTDDDDNPVKKARVILTMPEETLTEETDSKGFYEFKTVPSFLYFTVKVAKSGYRDSYEQRVRALTSNEILDFQLTPLTESQSKKTDSASKDKSSDSPKKGASAKSKTKETENEKERLEREKQRKAEEEREEKLKRYREEKDAKEAQIRYEKEEKLRREREEKEGKERKALEEREKIAREKQLKEDKEREEREDKLRRGREEKELRELKIKQEKEEKERKLREDKEKLDREREEREKQDKKEREKRLQEDKKKFDREKEDKLKQEKEEKERLERDKQRKAEEEREAREEKLKREKEEKERKLKQEKLDKEEREYEEARLKRERERAEKEKEEEARRAKEEKERADREKQRRADEERESRESQLRRDKEEKERRLRQEKEDREYEEARLKRERERADREREEENRRAKEEKDRADREKQRRADEEREAREEKLRRDREEREERESRSRRDREEKLRLEAEEREEKASRLKQEKAPKTKIKEESFSTESGRKAKSFRIRGTIANKYAAVSGVNLTLEPGGYEAVTDEKGKYSFESVPEKSRYVLRPYLPGVNFEPESAVFEDGKSNIAQDFTPYVSIEGETFFEGKPVAEVAVFLNDSKVAETNRFGKFKISPVDYNSPVSIYVSKAGFAFYPVTLNIRRIDKNYDNMRFFVSYSVSGKIAMSGSGSGLANTEIVISGSTNTTVLSDFTGNFSIQGLESGGTYKITPKAGGYKFTPPSRDYVLLRDNFVSQNFSASKETYNITGSVTIGGKPVKNATISITRRSLRYFTDDDGNFEIKTLDYGGPYTVSVQSREYQFEPIVINLLKEDMYIEFSTDLYLSGVVISGGKPIAGVTVDVNGSKYKTDENGRYLVKGLKYNGSYLVSLQAKGLMFEPFQKEYNGIKKSVQNEVFEASLVLSGRITSGNSALEGVTVVLGGAGVVPQTYKTDSNGYYTISNAKVGRDYVIEPSLPGYVFTPARKEYNNLTEGKLSENFKAVEKNAAIYAEPESEPLQSSPAASTPQPSQPQAKPKPAPAPEPAAPAQAVEQTYSLRGGIYNTFQRGIKGAVLKTSDGLSATTDSRGGYRIDGLKSNKRTVITPQLDEYHFYPESFTVSFSGNTDFNDVFAYPKKTVKPTAFVYGGVASEIIADNVSNVEIVAISNENGKITAQIVDEGDNPVNRLELDSQADVPAVFKWNMTSSSKKKVPSGEYSVILNGAGFSDEIVSFKLMR